jgi:glycosyltransferase involved in cell wall biosynthesis
MSEGRSPGGPVGEPSPPGSVPQRLVIVTPSTAEFHSRVDRLARTFAGRGHEVTVVAAWREGLPYTERHAGGYRIVRLEAHAIDGLPLSGLARGARAVFRRMAARRGTDRAVTRATAPTAVDAGSLRFGRAPRSLPARVAARLRRWLAVPLTQRSLGRAARRHDLPADIYHGMTFSRLGLAGELARRHGGRLVYDAGDIYLETTAYVGLHPLLRAWLARLERQGARRADRVVTVNDAYARLLAERLGVPSPLVIMNCPPATERSRPPARRFHDQLGLPADRRVVLYHGGFSRERGIEELIAAIGAVPGAVLVLMGYGLLEDEIRAAADRPELSGRVFVVPAVPPSELLDWVAAADVVAMPIQPTTLNHRFTTPNKLFEAMTVGVPVVVSDLPGMATIVRETGCGLLCDPTDPGDIAAAIREILDAPPERRRGWSEAGLAAARGRYNWERQVEALIAEYGRITGRPW